MPLATPPTGPRSPAAVGWNPIAMDTGDHTARSTQQFSITLPHDMAEAVRAKVVAGKYATESEVIRDGLRTLLARDRAVDQWLSKDVAAAFDALRADPSRVVSCSTVKARLAVAQATAMAKTKA
jgi:antitoxin ParD1/3/4